MYIVGVILGWSYLSFILNLDWLSGWFPTLVGFGVLLFFRSRSLFILLLIASVIGLYFAIPKLQATFQEEQRISGDTRAEARQNVLDIIVKHHYLLGTGPAGYVFYFTVYVGGLFQLSHNNYLDVVAQTGLVGFFVYLWMWLAMGWMALKTYRIVPRGGFRHGLAAALLAAWVVSIVAMMLGDWVLPFAYTQGIGGFDYTIWHWLMPGLTVALYYESKAHLEKSVVKAAPAELATTPLLRPLSTVK